MPRVLRCVVTLVLVLACGCARALPCASASLGDYLALGSVGCTVGALTFSGFTLPAVLSPAASAIDPAAVFVAPLASAPGAGLQLTFDPAQSAGPGEFRALRLGFDVQGSAITQAYAALLGPVAAGDAAVTLVEDVCLGASFTAATDLVCPASALNLIAIAIDGFTDNPVSASLGPADLLGIVAEIGVDGGLAGSALLAGAELRFLQAAAVPVPSSLALLALAASIAACCLGRRRRGAAA